MPLTTIASGLALIALLKHCEIVSAVVPPSHFWNLLPTPFTPDSIASAIFEQPSRARLQATWYTVLPAAGSNGARFDVGIVVGNCVFLAVAVLACCTVASAGLAAPPPPPLELDDDELLSLPHAAIPSATTRAAHIASVFRVVLTLSSIQGGGRASKRPRTVVRKQL